MHVSIALSFAIIMRKAMQIISCSYYAVKRSRKKSHLTREKVNLKRTIREFISTNEKEMKVRSHLNKMLFGMIREINNITFHSRRSQKIAIYQHNVKFVQPRLAQKKMTTAATAVVIRLTNVTM